jgi:glycosyltransferase involved in cell wall biosynthesis
MQILQTECSLNWGGQEKRSIEEIQWLRHYGHPTWLACDPKSAIFQRRSQFSEITEYIVPFDFSKSCNLKTTFALRQFIRKNKIDVLHVHSSRDAWIAYPLHLLGIPVIRSKHILLGEKVAWKKTFLFKFGCSRVIATANAIQDNLIHHGVSREKIDVIGEGVDLKKFKPEFQQSDFRKHWNLPPDVPLIGVIGMIRGEKGHMTFIQSAFRMLIRKLNVRFAIIGEGVGKKTHEEKCREAVKDGLKHIPENMEPIIFTGYYNDVREALSALDIVVVPSYSDGQTRVVPEAFAMGRAVIASRTGGLPELIQHNKNGILVPPGDIDALTEAMIDLINNPHKRSQLAEAGRETANEQLSFDKKMRALLLSYQQAIKGNKINKTSTSAVHVHFPQNLKVSRHY